MNQLRTSRTVLSFSACGAIMLAGTLGIASCDKTRPDGRQSDENARTEESTPSSASSGDRTGEAKGSEPGDAASSEPRTAEQSEKEARPKLLRGRVRPGRVTEVYARWRRRLRDLEVDSSDAEALADVPPGAQVTVYFGTWCPDSRREVPRLWRALEEAGGDVPFSVDYIALDHDFSAGDVPIEDTNINYVPTFVVKRDGDEVGRIVETSPTKLERDLYALLAGKKEGFLSRSVEQ